MSEPEKLPTSSVILYQTEDGRTRLDVRQQGETVWLSLNQMADLFQRDKSVISRHIKNVFDEKELREDSVVANFATTAADGKSYQVAYFNLDVVISVGYRVKSHRGTQFRIWATQRLREYIVKGFTMDDERLKNPPGKGQKDYFDELLERIRDIRSSERRFYQKVLDIYATSVDYVPDAEASQQFFATVQNKMHWAAHGHTAAEVIHERADATKPFMGLLTTRPGGIVRKDDAAIAKNYLTEDELRVLSRIVTLYIEYAELQALERRPMTMRDWITKLDEFLKISGRERLTHGGTISADTARAKAELEYARYRAWLDTQPRPVDLAFEKAIKQLQPPPPTKRKPRKSGAK
jgi:hypothetical protein